MDAECPVAAHQSHGTGSVINATARMSKCSRLCSLWTSSTREASCPSLSFTFLSPCSLSISPFYPSAVCFCDSSRPIEFCSSLYVSNAQCGRHCPARCFLFAHSDSEAIQHFRFFTSPPPHNLINYHIIDFGPESPSTYLVTRLIHQPTSSSTSSASQHHV